MKNSIACCYLTHNHVEAMSEVLDRCLTTYATHGIDICIYDDSDDDSTKNMVSSIISNGASNLYYIDAHAAISGDHKHLMILQGYGLPKDYDYIWPCKDRVCFDEPFIVELCKAIDKDHDVIIAANEYARWDVGENVFQDIYTDPVEFYRLYAVMSTNWESVIRKRSTMLKPVDWDRYKEKYNISENNNFNQTLSLFVRLSEMDNCSIRICRYSEERFISSKADSNWKDLTFQVWIDKWVPVNFSLPSIYDKYKSEAIKSETNIKELFGSVEGMITLHSNGIYSVSVFEKYKSIWPFVTNIPLNHLEMIAHGDYQNAVIETIKSFEQSFIDEDFKKAWWLISANTFFRNYYDDRTFRILVGCFNQYRREMMSSGTSTIFTNIHSFQDLMDKYSFVK